MKAQLSLALGVLALGASACATMDGGPSRYDQDRARLEADCTARGGVLAPTGRQTSQPALDSVCQVRGEPSERVQRPR